MKKIMLAGFLVIAAIAVQAATPLQDTTQKKSMQQKKMMKDSTGRRNWKKSDSSMHKQHDHMHKNKKRTDSSGTN